MGVKDLREWLNKLVVTDTPLCLAGLHQSGLTAFKLSGERVNADFSAARSIAEVRHAIAQTLSESVDPWHDCKLEVKPWLVLLIHGEEQLQDNDELGSLLPDRQVTVALRPVDWSVVAYG